MVSMDDDYYKYPAGSPEHYAAYDWHLIATGGLDVAVPGDPQASYEIDCAYELACERGYDDWYESLYQKHVEEQARWWGARGIQLAEDLLGCPESWLGGDWLPSHLAERALRLLLPGRGVTQGRGCGLPDAQAEGTRPPRARTGRPGSGEPVKGACGVPA
jgi:hypothetical protein